MEYSKAQLDCIQRNLIIAAKSLEEAKGFGAIVDGANLLTWSSHANLAGYLVDKKTGKMYKEQNKDERAYYDEAN